MYAAGLVRKADIFVQVIPFDVPCNITLLSPTIIHTESLVLYKIPLRFSTVPDVLVVQTYPSDDVLIVPLFPTAI